MTTTPKHDTTGGTPAASPAENRRWAVLAICCVAAALLGIDNSVLNYAIPSLSRQLGPSSTQLLWIVDIYGFVLGGMLVVAGNLGDRIGRRRLLLMGVAAFGVASALTAYADSAAMLIAARAPARRGRRHDHAVDALARPQRLHRPQGAHHRDRHQQRCGRAPASRWDRSSAACCWTTSGGARSS